MSTTQLQQVKIADIVPTSDNQRKNIEKSDGFSELVASIKAGGVRQVLLLRPHPDKKGKFDLRAGERRYRAAKAAGVETVPAIVYTGLTEADAMDLTFIENKYREDLKPLEEAAEVALLLERFGSIKAVVKKFGNNPQWWRVRANIAKGLIEPWRLYIEGKDGAGIVKSWSLSHFSLIARLPAHIQESLLSEIEADFWEYETMSAAELDQEIAKMLHLLSKAKWLLDDETLVPKAGACSKCEKRSGYQPMLWFDSDEQVKAGDQCTDEWCWKEKDMAWLERKAVEFRQDHPDLVLALTSSGRGVDEQAITEKLGAPLANWQYTTCSKATKGAVPAMYVNGNGIGKLAYIKLNNTGSSRAGKIKGTPTPLKKRREMLDAKRWAQVLIDLKEKVKAATVADITYPDKATAVMVLVSAYGNKSLWLSYHANYGDKPKVSQTEIKKLVRSEKCQARGLELLWQSFLPTLDKLLTYFGPITQTPRTFQDDADWIAAMIGVDLKNMFEDVSNRKGFTVPKSWAGLTADGTPKKAKAKKEKGKNKKTEAGSHEPEVRKCRVCGCTEANACADDGTGKPCHWVEKELCSKCMKE